MDVNEYRSVLHEDIALAASANMSNEEEEFLSYVTDILIAGEEFDDFTECYYEGVTRRKANMRIDGYAMDETDVYFFPIIVDHTGTMLFEPKISTHALKR